MLSFNEITREPMWSHLTRINVGSSEGSLSRLVLIRGWRWSPPLSEAWVEMRGHGSTAVAHSCFEVGRHVVPPRRLISEGGAMHCGPRVICFRMPPVRER